MLPSGPCPDTWVLAGLLPCLLGLCREARPGRPLQMVSRAHGEALGAGGGCRQGEPRARPWQAAGVEPTGWEQWGEGVSTRSKAVLWGGPRGPSPGTGGDGAMPTSSPQPWQHQAGGGCPRETPAPQPHARLPKGRAAPFGKPHGCFPGGALRGGSGARAPAPAEPR